MAVVERLLQQDQHHGKAGWGKARGAGSAGALIAAPYVPRERRIHCSCERGLADISTTTRSRMSGMTRSSARQSGCVFSAFRASYAARSAFVQPSYSSSVYAWMQ